MKKLFFIVVVSLLAICSYGQISVEYDTTYFRCEKISHDIKYYNHFQKKFGSNVVYWANGMKAIFPKDESERLHFTYVFNTDNAVDIDQIKRICSEWYDDTFPYCQIFFIEKTDNCIRGKGKYEYLSELPIVAGKRVTNHALIDVVIRIKDNRIKFEIIGRQYQYFIEYSANNTVINYYVPGTVFPFVEEYKIYN